MTDAAKNSEKRHAKVERFEIEQKGQVGFLTYSIDQGRLTIWHTEVPEPLQGKGIAGRLVQQAFAYARDKGLKVELICPFALRYVAKHPELQTEVIQ